MCGSLQTCAQTFWIGLDRQIAERTVARLARPFRKPVQFIFLRAGEKLVGLRERAFQSSRAQIILSSLYKGRVKLDRQNLF